MGSVTDSLLRQSSSIMEGSSNAALGQQLTVLILQFFYDQEPYLMGPNTQSIYTDKQ